MSYEHFLANLALWYSARAEDASFEDSDLAAKLYSQSDLIWDKAMKAAFYGA